MDWTSLHDRLTHLPLILAGPILRRTEPTAVTVWVALRQAATVTLKVYATREQGRTIDTALFTGQRSTVTLGQQLHLVAVTATPIAAEMLVPGQLYAYDLTIAPQGESTPQVGLHQAIQSPGLSPSISYFQHHLPTFALPPAELAHLKIMHGSCRKAHGKGQDALPIVDELIAAHAQQPDARPHQLFFTGDQVYGDDVGDPVLWLIQQVSPAVLGWQEVLPIATPGSVGTIAAELPPGQRSEIADKAGGFTAGLPKKPDHAKSHLFSFGEYCVIYLLAWSPTLWAAALPTGRELGHDRAQAKRWDAEVSAMESFIPTLHQVRRALANVPTYMIFDDHDISDDWYLNQAWCLRVLGKPLGRQTVRNGLLAYALFQAWGNTPEQFTLGKPGDKLLVATSAWVASQGKNPTAAAAIARYLGIPPTDPLTGLPQMRLDEQALILAHDAQSLKWHYTVQGACHEVIVLDTRTWRGYPSEAAPSAPPMLLSPSAFDQQLRQPLAANPHPQATLIVAPTNLVSLQLIDQIQHWHAHRRNMFQHDVGDAWNVHKAALSEFLETLFEQRDRIIILTGDIHYSAAVQLAFWSRQHPHPQMLAQLTASAMENAEFKTRVIHTKLKSLLPERRRSWIGWHHAPEQLTEVSNLTAELFQGKSATRPEQPPPDWGYQIDWMPRQPAQNPAWGTGLSWLQPTRSPKCRDRLAGLWRNRWLQEGREVIGLTNIGLVQFQTDSLPSTAISQPQSVTQDIFWFPPWQPGAVVSSRFGVSLLPPTQPKP